jgi:tetratricopeptide (TPR) repeat protein
MQKELLARIKHLVRIDEREELTLAEELLEEHLKHYPQDTEAWLRLFMVRISDRLFDELKAAQCCKKILEYEANNIYALLGLTYLCYYWFVEYDAKMMESLFKFQSNNYEEMSLIEFARAWYYEDQKNAMLQEKILLKSIMYSDIFVFNYEMLGDLYARQGRFAEAVPFLKKALANIQTIVSGPGEYLADKSDIESLLDDFFRGAVVSDFRRDDIQKTLDYCIEQLSEIN